VTTLLTVKVKKKIENIRSGEI